VFNRKLKRRTNYLESEVYKLKAIIKLLIKCSECGDSAKMIVCRRFKYNNGKLEAVDTFLCDKCIKILMCEGCEI